jgi:hypothetical protein
LTNVSETRNLTAIYCGDSIANGAEQCDGSDLKGENCTHLGYDKGTLSCTVSCHFTGCSNNGGGGGPLVSVPPVQGVGEEAKEEQLPVVEVVGATQKPVSEEKEVTLVVEQPAVVIAEKTKSYFFQIAFLILLFALMAVFIYLKTRKRDQT